MAIIPDVLYHLWYDAECPNSASEYRRAKARWYCCMGSMKKSQKTAKTDLDLAIERMRVVERER